MVGTWKETEVNNKYAIATYNYESDKEGHLCFDVGDTFNLIYVTKAWYYGFCTRDPDRRGVIPQTYIKVKESINVQGCIYPNEPPIAREISSVLKAWGALWKDLYLTSFQPDVRAEFEKLQATIYELLDTRQIILSRKLTLEEMKELQKQVSKKIDIGNARLGLDLVVRDENCNAIDPFNTSTISLFRMHQQAARVISEERNMFDKGSLKKTYAFNLYVNVKNFVCRIGENALILLTLYDAKESSFISEHYIMRWGEQGMMKDLDSFNNMRVIYTDLSEKDILNDKIFLVCQIIRIGRMDLKETDSKKFTKGMKRPFGVASINVSDILNGKTDSDDEKQYFIPFLQSGDNDFMDVVIRKSISAKDINHKGQGLWVTMRHLLGDRNQLHKDYPHLVTNTTFFARKMGFPDVIMPADTRNDLYVTIRQGEFKKGGNKMTDKNIQVALTLCNENGEPMPGKISEGAGGNMVDSYNSIVYYHEDKPKWSETIKIDIPTSGFNGMHLRFTFKHRSTTEAKDKAEKAFALSYIRLMNDNGTTLNDTNHELLVYKLDSKKSDDIGSGYLKLPSTQKELQVLAEQSGSSLKMAAFSPGPLSLCVNDVFQISTLICSNKLTHNVELMSLLKWRDNLANLHQLLDKFMTVDGEEVVKFLDDALDALFIILIEHSDSINSDKRVFDALVFLLSIVSDHKYNQFESVLDHYINTSFSATMAYTKLLVVLKWYIDDVTDLTKAQHVMASMEVLEYIFKFIVCSRSLFARLNENRGLQKFNQLLSELFSSINNLMKSGREVASGLCARFLSCLPSIIPHLLLITKPVELCVMLIECLNSVPHKKLILAKMTCINKIMHCQLFKFHDCRHKLLPVMLNHVHNLMSFHVDLLQNNHHSVHSPSDPDPRYFQELDTCFQILADVLDYLFHLERSSTHEDVKVLSVKVLRLVTKTTIFVDKTSTLVATCAAVLTGVLRQMDESHFKHYMSHFETAFDLIDFLMEILMIFEDLVTRSVFSVDWSEMIMLQNWVFLQALRYFSKIIKDQFTNPFYDELWRRFFLSTIAFITQPPLQLELFDPAKRNRILFHYKDMRREAASEVRSMWHSLGPHKIIFIPDVVGAFLQMTMVSDKDLRLWTIPIFFDMMKVECQYNASRGKRKHFHRFEQELIARVDELITANQGDESYMHLFYDIIKENSEGNKAMCEQGLAFVDTMRQLMGLLLQYRTVLAEESSDNKMICLVSLLNFYRESNREELYIRCLNKLCTLHLECRNHTEAAYTLLLHAKLLKWSGDALPSMLMSPQLPEHTDHRSLKEDLYYKIIDYFVEGKMWEKGIELCKELAHQCEVQTFDYLQLSAILKKQAELYDSIMTVIRPEPEYFRVSYYGTDFHPFLQNRTFIYRGKDYERLGDFIARMLTHFSDAQLLKTLTTPSDEVQKLPKKSLQINKVTPVMELRENLANKRLSDQILKYYKVNEVQKFMYSRKKSETSNEFSSMWVEKTVLVTSESFPGILHWFPVVSTQQFDVSPLELAIETIEETNLKMSSLLDQQQNDPSCKVDQLGMVLNGVVDAAVNGGIANYKVFYSEEYQREHVEESELIERLRNCTTEQLRVLGDAIVVHRMKAPENMQPLNQHMGVRYAEMTKTLNKEYGIQLPPQKDDSTDSRDSVSSTSSSMRSAYLSGVSRKEATPSKNQEHEKSPSMVSKETPTNPSKTSIPFSNLLRTKVDSGFFSANQSSDNSDSKQKSFLLRNTSPRASAFKSPEQDSFHSENAASSRLRPPSHTSHRTNHTSTLSVHTYPTSNEGNTDEPPPLPEKTSHSDYANLAAQGSANNSPRTSVHAIRNTYREKPAVPSPTTPNQMSLPPKKHQKQFNFNEDSTDPPNN